jgi:hypothetical protein
LRRELTHREIVSCAIHPRIQVRANKSSKMNGLRRVFAVAPLMD